MALDERLRRGLEGAARPADPAGVYEDLIRRRERLRIRRRVSAAVIAFAVFAVGAVGLYALSRATGGDHPRPAGIGTPEGRLLFVARDPDRGITEVSFGWGIASMAPDGSDMHDLHPPELDESLYPTASPDGSRIAFFGLIAEPRSSAVYVMNADGTGLTAVLDLDRRHQVQQLAWSPDGSRIGMVMMETLPVGPEPASGSPDRTDTRTIWTMAPDGSDLRQVTTVGREQSMAWSPDGKRIAFTRTEPIDPDVQDTPTDLYIVDADGSNEVRITETGDAWDAPAWSPDGTDIAYAGTSPSGEGLDLYLIAQDGGDRRRLTTAPGNEYGSVWSPDGIVLLYIETAVDAGSENSECRVSTIRSDGTEPRTLISGETCPGSYGLWWSPTPSTDLPAPTAVRGPTAATGPIATAGKGTTDLGLGYPVCEVNSVVGHFVVDDVTGTAYVFTDASDGCPDVANGNGVQQLGIDFTGDGTIETAVDLEGCDAFCGLFATPDVDGDGTDEVLVQNIQFSIAGLRLYDIAIGTPGADGPFIRPVTIASPGYPGEGLAPGTKPQFFLGGDAFLSDSLRCVGSPERTLVQSSAVMDPPDSPSSVWKVDQTTFVLQPDGTMVVTDVRHFEEAADGDVSFAQTDGVCGARLPYPYGD